MSDQPPARGPRKWNRPAVIVVGVLTVAVAVSVSLAVEGGHGSGSALSAKVSDTTTASPVTPTSASSALAASASASSAGPSSSSTRSSSSQASTRSADTAPWASTSCPSQLASWRGTGAGGQLQVVVTDLTIASQAAISMRADPASGTIPADAVTALNSATASLRLSTQAAGKNLIPGCVSSAHQAEVAALTALVHAADGLGTAVSQSASGDYGTAQHSSQTAVAALQSGSAEMATAIVDVGQYGTK